ncbi:hypothetical protein ACFPFV_11745 [Salinicoccus siamensis]|uniref:hypothetical protein n=1 Tax=Salinicoccus siamensis TaxID=381830 RepID=UPI003607F10E
MEIILINERMLLDEKISFSQLGISSRHTNVYRIKRYGTGRRGRRRQNGLGGSTAC